MEELYWHNGDGGLYENQGLENLVFLYQRQLQTKRAKRTLIIVFDGTFPFSVGERKLLHRSQPFNLLNFEFSRVPSIMEERATTYQALFFQSLQIEGVTPDRTTITVLRLRRSCGRLAAATILMRRQNLSRLHHRRLAWASGVW